MLKQYHGGSTKDPEVSRRILATQFDSHFFECTTRRQRYSSYAHWADTSQLRITDLFCTAQTETVYEQAPVVRQYFLMAGEGEMRAAVEKKSLDPLSSNASLILPAAARYRLHTPPQHRLIAIRYSVDALNANLRAMLGDDPGQSLMFTRADATNSGSHHAMRDAVAQFLRDLDYIGPANQFAREELSRSLIIKFLLFSPNNYRERLHSGVKSLSMTQLRKVEEFIEANADRPISIDEITTEFGFSARTIFRYFKTVRGESPGEFIRRARLNRARQSFQTCGDSSGIMSIAMKYGFQSLGHFSRDYRKLFHELPSQTLRRHKLGLKD